MQLGNSRAVLDALDEASDRSLRWVARLDEAALNGVLAGYVLEVYREHSEEAQSLLWVLAAIDDATRAAVLEAIRGAVGVTEEELKALCVDAAGDRALRFTQVPLPGGVTRSTLFVDAGQQVALPQKRHGLVTLPMQAWTPAWFGVAVVLGVGVGAVMPALGLWAIAATLLLAGAWHWYAIRTTAACVTQADELVAAGGLDLMEPDLMLLLHDRRQFVRRAEEAAKKLMSEALLGASDSRVDAVRRATATAVKKLVEGSQADAQIERTTDQLARLASQTEEWAALKEKLAAEERLRDGHYRLMEKALGVAEENVQSLEREVVGARAQLEVAGERHGWSDPREAESQLDAESAELDDLRPPE